MYGCFFATLFGPFFSVFFIFFHFFVQKGVVSFENVVKIGCVFKNRAFLDGVLFFRNVVVFWNIDVVFSHHCNGEVRSQKSEFRRNFATEVTENTENFNYF